jgi:hypothetical protein
MRVDEKPGSEYRSVIKQFSLENCTCTPLPPVTFEAEFGVDLNFSTLHCHITEHVMADFRRYQIWMAMRRVDCPEQSNVS